MRIELTDYSNADGDCLVCMKAGCSGKHVANITTEGEKVANVTLELAFRVPAEAQFTDIMGLVSEFMSKASYDNSPGLMWIASNIDMGAEGEEGNNRTDD